MTRLGASGASIRIVLSLLVAACAALAGALGDKVSRGPSDAARPRARKALVAPTRVEAIVGTWSDLIELEFVPTNEVNVSFKVNAFGSGSNAQDLTFDPPLLRFDGTEGTERKSFRVKCKGNTGGFYTVLYEFKSDTPFPFEGVRQTVVHVSDKARVSLVQPMGSKLVVGQTSLTHRVALTRPLDVTVVPVAQHGVTFEPAEFTFSRKDAAGSSKEFRVLVPPALPESLRTQPNRFAVSVDLELKCGNGSGDSPSCDLDGVYEPAGFVWEVLDVNRVLAEDSVFGTAADTGLPFSFAHPQDALVEIYAPDLVLSKHAVRVSARDVGTNREVRVVGRRDAGRRPCPPSAPCEYYVRYVVKESGGGKVGGNFKPARPGAGFHAETRVVVVDFCEVTVPEKSTAFVGQALELSVGWAEEASTAREEGEGEVLLEVEATAPEGVEVEPRRVQLRAGGGAAAVFRVTPSKEGRFVVAFGATGGTLRAAAAFAPSPVTSIVVYDSFNSDGFSFEERYGIGGLDEELNTILRRAMFSRLAKPEVVEALGVSHVRGILLWGPPGCGKTTIARQIGAMLLMPEPKVVNGPEIVSKYLGESENKVRDLFRDAEENPNEHHLIVFDEIDALVKPRGRGQGEAADQVYDGIVNTLLSKMDGIDRLDNVLVVGTTNRRDLIDPALLRPGRFDVQVKIDLPTEEGRREIFNIHTREMRRSGLVDNGVDLAKLATMARTFTGAEIEGVVKSAASLAVEEAMRQPSPSTTTGGLLVTQEHFERALGEIEPANSDSSDALAGLYGGGGLLEFSKEMAGAMDRFEGAIRYASGGEGGRAVSVLVHGPPGSGKTSFAAGLLSRALDDGQVARLEVLSAEQLLREDRRADAVWDAFAVAEGSRGQPRGCLLLDDLDGIIEHVDTMAGSYVNSPLYSQLRVLLASAERAGLVLVATTTTASAEKFDQISALFDVEVELPPVRTEQEVKAALSSAGIEEDALDLSEIAGQLPLPIKTLMKRVDLVRTGNADLLPRFGAPVRKDDGEAETLSMVDVVANNHTSVKIFMI